MMLGTGIDMVDIRRIEKLLTKRFITRIFTPAEQTACDSRKERVAAYAKRFAAKEAAAKALGSGIGKDALFKDIEVSNDASGAPHLTLNGRALVRLKKITPKGYKPKLFLALSDEFPYAIASVTIEAIPA